MLLKIGELAKMTGLSIRTLHHYDSIGLLSPSARTQAGYRLYQHGDMDRLHRSWRCASSGCRWPKSPLHSPARICP
jgi:DNA-binding transcriptional MerR regulator